MDTFSRTQLLKLPLKSIYIYIYITPYILPNLCIYVFIYIYICSVLTLNTLSSIARFKNYIYIYTGRWSNDRIKTKTTMFHENSNTLTSMVWKTRYKQSICRPDTPIWPKLYLNIRPKSRQMYVYMIKSAKIHNIFSKYMEFLQDLCSTGAKANKVTGGFLVESSPRP